MQKQIPKFHHLHAKVSPASFIQLNKTKSKPKKIAYYYFIKKKRKHHRFHQILDLKLLLILMHLSQEMGQSSPKNFLAKICYAEKSLQNHFSEGEALPCFDM